MTRRQVRPSRWLGAWSCLLIAFPVVDRADAIDQVRGCASALFRDRVAAIAPAGADIDKILQPALWIKKLESPKLRDLPFQLYEVQYTLVRPSLTAYLVSDEARCQLVGGTLNELLGEEVGWEQKRRFAIESLNGFLVQTDPHVPTAERALLRYAYGVAIVLYLDDQIEILEDVASLRRIVDETPSETGDSDEATTRTRQALETYELPRIRYNHGVPVAEFVSWTSLGGALRRHHVSVLSNGAIDEHSEILVREVGRYTKVQYRM